MKKLLLDECVPQRLRHSLLEFDVYSATYMGWIGIKNGALLKLAVENNFDLFLTTDKNLRFQQNLENFPLSIIVFDVVKLELENILVLLPKFKEMGGTFEKHKVYIIE
ncbi:MAG: hypothetical protein JWO06_455 [Bacteroidota bacterium]|nr:hypothetical protein [Bacteroidota bacterium]